VPAYLRKLADLKTQLAVRSLSENSVKCEQIELLKKMEKKSEVSKKTEKKTEVPKKTVKKTEVPKKIEKKNVESGATSDEILRCSEESKKPTETTRAKLVLCNLNVNVARRNSSMLESKAQTADCSKIFS
jgi:hypothetical protein